MGGDPKPLAMLRKVAGFSGVTATNYLGDLRRELEAQV
jgi:hypothetical protein